MYKIILPFIKKILPITVLKALRRIKYRKNRSSSLQTIFSEIYDKKVWGGALARSTDFHSGGGSLESVTKEYENFIMKFIVDKNVKSIVDLGCGDFQVGARILSKANCSYTGVDVVPNLIDRNNKKFSNEKVKFLSMNIAEDELPKGELCLIREVLQHLDNLNIKKVLNNLKEYKYILITESVARNTTKYNIDITAGHWTRSLIDSGVFIEKSPFSVQAEKVLEYGHPDSGVLIRTMLIENSSVF